MKKVISVFLFFVFLIAGFIFWQKNNPHRQSLEKQVRYMMDTYVTIYAYGPKYKASLAIDHAFKRMEEIAKKFDAHNETSPVYAFNHNSIAIVDPEILLVARLALDVSKGSSGAFDITIYPLVKLWDFYKEKKQVPSENEIKEVLNNVGYQYLIIKDGKLSSDKKGIAIDFGGIAKGYAVDQAREVLKKDGLKSAMIDAGGSICAIGTNKGKPWKVGLQHPRKEGIFGFVEVCDTALNTSGDYRRFFKVGGKRYSHILNPKTGYPVDEFSSVTVIYPNSTLSDAWSTAVFVLGKDKGLEAVKGIMGMELIMTGIDGEIFYSKGLEDKLIQ